MYGFEPHSHLSRHAALLLEQVVECAPGHAQCLGERDLGDGPGRDLLCEQIGRMCWFSGCGVRTYLA